MGETVQYVPHCFQSTSFICFYLSFFSFPFCFFYLIFNYFRDNSFDFLKLSTKGRRFVCLYYQFISAVEQRSNRYRLKGNKGTKNNSIIFPFFLLCFFVIDASQNGIVIVFYSFTENKLMELWLERVYRMSSKFGSYTFVFVLFFKIAIY